MEEAEAAAGLERAASPSASQLELGGGFQAASTTSATSAGPRRSSGDSSVFLSAAPPLPPKLGSSTREHVLSRNPASSLHPTPSLHPTTTLLPTTSLLPIATEQRPSIASARSPVCRLVFPKEVEGEELEDVDEVKERDGVFIFDDEKGEARYIAS